ncbi:MAG: prephenate dehydratase [Paludibacteraceae bacterium]|nr:prephenate dehydratase [Paludibacteraceae bacterium]
MKRVAIQGIAGSFHDIAAREYFKDEEIEIVPCETFAQVFQTMKSDTSLISLVAIENTIAGSLLQNHQLLKNSGLKIAGEHKLRIKHNLVAIAGQSVEDIKEVYSHPIALMQCGEFLGQNKGIKAIEYDDTASSAKMIAELNETGKAAICGEEAAQIYGLEILAKGIETNKRNFTRFLVLADPWMVDDLNQKRQPNKASLAFVLPHEEGSLAQVLSILSYYKMNLTKIQSMPIIGHEWEYEFFVDLRFEDYLRFKQSLDAIGPLTKGLTILGEYQEGKQTL